MSPEERIALIEDLKIALQDTAIHQLTPEEKQWVQMAIKAQADRAALRKAIIEKSISSLIWSGIVGMGYILLEYLTNHGLKL